MIWLVFFGGYDQIENNFWDYPTFSHGVKPSIAPMDTALNTGAGVEHFFINSQFLSRLIFEYGLWMQKLDTNPASPASGICIQVDARYDRCWIQVLDIDAGCTIQMLDLYETPASGTCIQHLHPTVVKIKVHWSKMHFSTKINNRDTKYCQILIFKVIFQY